MTISELLLVDQGFALLEVTSPPEMDPFTEEDALREAQLLDVRFDALAGVVGILLELRQSLEFWHTNTGVLVARGVRELKWSGPARATSLWALAVTGTGVSVTASLFRLSLDLWLPPGAQLSLTAEDAAFYTGNVPELTDAPPDYADNTRSTIIGNVPSLDSLFEPASAVFLYPAAP